MTSPHTSPPEASWPYYLIPSWIKISLLIFLLALGPRLYALGTFLTIDEVKWAQGAGQFLGALQSGHFEQTYWHFFPGITISWGGALALWALCGPTSAGEACVQTHLENLAQTIGWLRLSPVVLTSLGITAVYAMGRRGWGDRLAGLTALLLAFDPFFLAHSRILNGDAVAAMFMFLSLLAFLLYAFDKAARMAVWSPAVLHPWLLASGTLAGLAWLTKLPAPLIGAFVTGLALVAAALEWRQRGAAAGWRWLAALVIWGGMAGLVFVVLWPAMWVAPLATLRQMYLDTFEVGGMGEGHATFFMGQIGDDPGAWFYPYTIAFRLTPVIMVGLVAVAGWLGVKAVRYFFSPPSLPPDPHRAAAKRLVITAWVMLAFVIFVVLLANASPKKLDRYVMAVIPGLIFLAAIGLTELGGWVQAAFRPVILSRLWFMGLVTLQFLFALLALPYYLTYYNPLLGGARQLVAQAPAGWGEGLEQAAFYLNQLPNAESMAVSSWYGDVFQAYFIGRPASFSDDGRSQLAADYVVFYINQIQRQKPFSGLVNYFRANRPVFVLAVEPTGQVVKLVNPPLDDNRVHWVEVYQAPAAQSVSGAPKIEGVAQLLAYKITGPRLANNSVESLPADELSIILFLRVLGPLPAQTTFKAALANNDNLWGEWQTTDVKGLWQPDNLVEWHGRLTLPPDVSAGEYRLWTAFQFEDGVVIAQFDQSDKDPPLLIKP